MSLKQKQKSRRKVGEVWMNLFKRLKRYNLRSELAAWVEKNIGPGYVDEALENYDKINSGVPIGGIAETVAFVSMVETVKHEVEGR